MPALWLLALCAAGTALAAALAAFLVWTTFFRRYRVHRIVYGSDQIRRDFQDAEALTWPIPRTLLTRKQFVTAFNDYPAATLDYERHTFPCKIWPELGVVAYEEVFLPGRRPEDTAPLRPLAGEKGVYLFVCPLSCNTHVRCMRRTMHVLLSAGYRCYVLVSRGYGGHLMDAQSQKLYLDECWNLQDVFEFVRHLEEGMGALPPLHLCGHSLGGMRVAHFVAQVAKLSRKQADEAAGRASPVRHDGDNMLRHTWRGYDNEATRRVARLLRESLASCAMLYPHYDPAQPFLALLRAPRDISWAMRPHVKENEAALRVYLRESLRESALAGRDPRSADSEALARYVDSEAERIIGLAETSLGTGVEYDQVLTAPLTRQESVTDYYTSSVVTAEELREIAGFTAASGARALYFGVADDTLAADVFPHDYAAQGIEGNVLAVQLNRGEHVGTVLAGGKDVVSYFVLRVAESVGRRGKAGNAAEAGKANPAEPGREE